MGFAYGVTPIVGSLFGREENEKIGGILKNALLVNTLLVVLLVAIMWLLYANLGNLGQPEELLPIMRPYFIVNLVSLPFVSWFNTFKQLCDGNHRYEDSNVDYAGWKPTQCSRQLRLNIW